MENASYLTKEGAKKLKAELDNLKGPVREALAKRLRTAIQQGDLSENADYISAKEEQGFLEGRILDLENTLRNVIIIDDETPAGNEIGIGSRFIVEEEGEIFETYYIIGPKEADPAQGRISYESPIGKALLGHKPGEIIEIKTPGGITKLKIVKIL